jgi:hypothetical protein
MRRWLSTLDMTPAVRGKIGAKVPADRDRGTAANSCWTASPNKPEPLVEIAAEDAATLARLAWPQSKRGSSRSAAPMSTVMVQIAASSKRPPRSPSSLALSRVSR